MAIRSVSDLSRVLTLAVAEGLHTVSPDDSAAVMRLVVTRTNSGGLKMKRVTMLGFVVSGCAWFGAVGADAAILVDNSNNLAQTIALPTNSSSLQTSSRGVTFTVGSNALTLTSAVFGLYANSAGNANVGLRLFAGSTAQGTALQEVAATNVTLNTIAGGGSPITFTTSGWTLAANTQYTVAAFDGAGGSQTPRLGVSALVSGSWASSGLTFNQFTQGTLNSSPDNYWVPLNGTTAGAVPASGLAGLGGVGVAGLARRRRG